MAHLEHASAAQPHGSTSNRVHGVYRPSCRCRSIEIEAIKVNPAQNGETTHLWCGHVTQPHGNPLGAFLWGHWTHPTMQSNQIHTYKHQLQAARSKYIPRASPAHASISTGSNTGATPHKGRKSTIRTQTATRNAQNQAYE